MPSAVEKHDTATGNATTTGCFAEMRIH